MEQTESTYSRLSKAQPHHLSEERAAGTTIYQHGLDGASGQESNEEDGMELERTAGASLSEPAAKTTTPNSTAPPPPPPSVSRSDFSSCLSFPSEMDSTTHRDRDEPSSQNGVGVVGPHPSFINVANPYLFEQQIQACLAALGTTEAKEANARLQGVMWIDNVRRALQL